MSTQEVAQELARLLTTLRERRTTALGEAERLNGQIAAVAELTAGVAGSSFFPTQSTVPYLVVWGLVVRFQVERAAHGHAGRAAAMRRRPATRRLVRPELGKAL